jgi:predicted metal-binding protein
MRLKKLLIGMVLTTILLSSCSVFRKKCNCPKVSQEKLVIEKVYG